jgi:hypothetical protein
MVVLTKKQKLIGLAVAGVVVVGIIAGIVLSQSKDPAKPATKSSGGSTNPTSVNKAIIITGTYPDGGSDRSKDIKKTVVITDTQSFINGKGPYHGGEQKGCWSLDDVQEWTDKLKIGGNCVVTSIQLPADIKATAYTSNRFWFSDWNNLCAQKKIVDIPAGTTKEFKSGSVCGFKFEKA